MENIKKFLFILLLTSFPIIFSLFFFLNTEPIVTFSIVYISSSLVFLMMSWFIIKYEFTIRSVILISIIGILIRFSFISTTPIGSDDIYRYMWDGKIQYNGINPYKNAPSDAELSHLHSALLPEKVNFPEMKSIYFPFSQWLFFTGYSISGEEVWGYKLLLLIAEIFTILVLFYALRREKLPIKYLLLYVLCPLSIIHFSLDGHLDGFGLQLLLASLVLYNKKPISSLILLGFSLSIKPIGLLLIPLLFLYDKNTKNRLLIILIPLLVFFVQFIPYIFSSNPFEALLIYTEHWEFNGFVFEILNSFIKNNQTTRIICGISFVIVLIPLLLTSMDLYTKFYYAILILLLFSPVVHPWYIAWLVVLLPLVPRWSGILYAALSSLTAFTLMSHILHGVWKEYNSVLLLEYIPVILLMLYELFWEKGKGKI